MNFEITPQIGCGEKALGFAMSREPILGDFFKTCWSFGVESTFHADDNLSRLLTGSVDIEMSGVADGDPFLLAGRIACNSEERFISSWGDANVMPNASWIREGVKLV